jgi:hypothetical protein
MLETIDKNVTVVWILQSDQKETSAHELAMQGQPKEGFG